VSSPTSSVSSEGARLIRQVTHEAQGAGSGEARRRAAAAKILLAFRRFRARFPEGGKQFSMSSTTPIVYQEEPQFREVLAAEFSEMLLRMVAMTTEERMHLVTDGRRVLGLGPSLPDDYVKATLSRNGRVIFTDSRWLGRWAAIGYSQAVMRLQAMEGGDQEKALARMREFGLDEINFALGYVQAHAAAYLVASVDGLSRVRVLRSVVQTKSPEKVKRGVLALRRGVYLPDASAAKLIVGGPGDRFKFAPDMRRFLDVALGGFERYRWQMNPRRRRRVKGRPQKWMLHVNFGASQIEVYRWLRLMYGSHGDMQASRNWSHIFPRPLGIGPTANQENVLDGPLRDLLRRYLLTAASSQASTRSRFMSMSRTAPKRPSPPAMRSRSVALDFPHAAGVVIGGDKKAEVHAGMFVAWVETLPDTNLALTFVLMDPHAMLTFDRADLKRLKGALRRAMKRVGMGGVVLRFNAVNADPSLRVQYQHEGSCSPSSVALVLSALRRLRTLALDAGRPATVDVARFAVDTFNGVREEDMVLVAQLTHNFAR
jgi:hypothetical protein